MLAISKNYKFQGHNHPANHWYWWPDTLIIAQVLVTHRMDHKPTYKYQASL